MKVHRVGVRTAMIEVTGSRRLRVSQYREPEAGREVLRISRCWGDEEFGLAGDAEQSLVLPAGIRRELIDALEALGPGEA